MITLGLTRLFTEEIRLVRRRRVGLITNAVACDEKGVPGLRRFLREKRLRLNALFAPEHGISGRLPAGESVTERRRDLYGVPLYHLCGRDRAPTAQLLANLDVVVFDLQDVGCRYYTYLATMLQAMEAAAEAKVSFAVLDRPNPLGGEIVQGNVLNAEFRSSIGFHAVAIRHGMTAGEIALMFREETRLMVKLDIVRMRGWERGMYFDETRLRWIAPSPNLARFNAVLCYPGTCLFEGTNLSEGRGTGMPFEQIGAPWLDVATVLRDFVPVQANGISLERTTFKPKSSKYQNDVCNGIRWRCVDRDRADPAATGIELLSAIRNVHGEKLQFEQEHFDRLAGTDSVRRQLLGGDTPKTIQAQWCEQLRVFREGRDRFLLY